MMAFVHACRQLDAAVDVVASARPALGAGNLQLMASTVAIKQVKDSTDAVPRPNRKHACDVQPVPQPTQCSTPQ